MRITQRIKSLFLNLSVHNRLTKTKKIKRISRNAFIAIGTFIFLMWKSYDKRGPIEERVISVNREMWDLMIHNTKLRNWNRKTPLDTNKEIKKLVFPHYLTTEMFPSKTKSRNLFKNKQILNVSISNKNEWLLQLLKYPVNVKKEPFSPRDSSFPIMTKDGVRKPLEGGEPVMLIWWPPEYLAKTRKENLLEREFQGVCGKCRLTTDRSTLSIANVLLFDNIPTKFNLEDLPAKQTRRPEQAYVLWHRETPAKTHHLKGGMRGRFDQMFNYTLSYRRDSDIHWYLGNADFTRRSMPVSYRRKPRQYVDKIVQSKRHLAAWVVSNCNNTRGAVARMKYASQLIEAGLKLDEFGRCFDRHVPRNNFFEFLLPYKFYLSFENSWHCKDYLSEKFWKNGLMANVIPVIWGPLRQDVADVAPTHSYIHSEDFDSPKKLVEYLKYLDGNITAYREYFKWRLEPVSLEVPVNMIRTGYEPAMCKICRVLNENKGVLPRKILPSATDWVFIDGDDSKCLLYDLI